MKGFPMPFPLPLPFSDPPTRPLGRRAISGISRLLVLAIVLSGAWPPARGQTPPGQPANASPAPEAETWAKYVETVIPYEGDLIRIRSKEQTSEKGVLRASGGVVILFRQMELQADELQYDSATQAVTGRGNILFRQGLQELRCAEFQIDVKSKTGRFLDSTGVADKLFRLNAGVVEKVGEAEYIFQEGRVTTCEKADHPHWSCSSAYTRLLRDQSATLRRSVFRLFGLPVFYLPWVKFPIPNMERRSGLMIPSIGNSSEKGFQVSQSWYQTLGRSADVILTGEYYSERGYGFGTSFRSRLSDTSYLNFSSFTVDDNQDEGGSAFNANAYLTFGHGWTGAANVNTLTNIKFRQTYDDNFLGAIRPDEIISGFLTKYQDTYGFNLLADRRQFYLDDRNLMVRALPEASFTILGQPLLGRSAYLYLEASAGGFSKEVSWRQADNLGVTRNYSFSTPGFVSRLHLAPELFLPLDIGGLFQITLAPSFRATYYSHSLTEAPSPENPAPAATADGFTRWLPSMEASLLLPRFFKVYQVFGRPVKHVVEMGADWRFTSEAGDFSRTIRFDPVDALCGMNLAEYWIRQRFLIRDKEGQTREFLSLLLRQDYYLEPDFYGNLVPGESNQLEPMYRFSPYASLNAPRRFSPLQALLEVHTDRRHSVYTRVEYDTVRGQMRDWSVAATMDQNWLYTSVALLRMRSVESGPLDNNYIQTSLGLGRTRRGLSADVNVAYNLNEDNLDNVYLRASYFFDCLGVSVEFSNFDIANRRQEKEIRFSLFLKGLGEFGELRKLGRRYF